jgi:hypothetical protein
MRQTMKRLLVVCMMSGSLLISSGAMRAQNSVAAIATTFSLEANPITQGEPVVLEMAFDNRSRQGVVVNLGNQDEKLDIEVVEPDGHVLQKPKPIVREGWEPVDAFNVPGEAKSLGSVSLNDWFTFVKVGNYQVEITLSPIPSPREPFVYNISGNHVVLTLTVLPRDETSLASACAVLLSRVKDLQSSATALTAAKALSSVNDPVAVPYLAAALERREFASMMIAALARLNTEKAVAALSDASRSNDPETRNLARSALVSLTETKKR